jgi:branched-chain amino acid aminotransferase
VADGVLCTPTTDACPEGITRATVLRLAEDAGILTEVGDYPLTRLYSAAEAFVTGTMGELTPVLAVDGRRIGDGAGPVTKQLSAAYAELTSTSGIRVV